MFYHFDHVLVEVRMRKYGAVAGLAGAAALSAVMGFAQPATGVVDWGAPRVIVSGEAVVNPWRMNESDWR